MVLISYERIDNYSNNQLDLIQQTDLRVNVPNSCVVYEKPIYGCILYRVKCVSLGYKNFSLYALWSYR